MAEPITREDIAEIYEQLGVIEMRKAQEWIKDYSDTDSSILDRSFEFFTTADQYREIDKMKPMRERLGEPCEGFNFVRAETNLW
jgi:hypothetical protein